MSDTTPTDALVAEIDALSANWENSRRAQFHMLLLRARDRIVEDHGTIGLLGIKCERLSILEQATTDQGTVHEAAQETIRRTRLYFERHAPQILGLDQNGDPLLNDPTTDQPDNSAVVADPAAMPSTPQWIARKALEGK